MKTQSGARECTCTQTSIRLQSSSTTTLTVGFEEVIQTKAVKSAFNMQCSHQIAVHVVCTFHQWLSIHAHIAANAHTHNLPPSVQPQVAPAIRPPSRESAQPRPTIGRTFSGVVDGGNTESSNENALHEILAEEGAEEGAEDIDPMLAEGPTETTPQAPPPPVAATTTRAPVAPPPAPAPPPPPAVVASSSSATRVPWPYCCGNQPPTANPYVTQVLPPSAAPTYQEFYQKRVEMQAGVREKYGSFCANWPKDTTLVHYCWTGIVHEDKQGLSQASFCFALLLHFYKAINTVISSI